MAHLDPERLSLHALEHAPMAEPDREHLEGCAACRGEYEALSEVAALGRETRALRELPAPPASVWAAIAAALPTGPHTTGPHPTVPHPTVPHPTVPHPTVPRRRREPAWTRPWWRPAALAGVAAMVAVLATVGVTAVLRHADQPVVTAQAALAAYGRTPPTAHGSASVLVLSGQSQLRLVVADLPASGGYYEVWLINPDTNEMISVGVLGGQSTVVLPLPASVDLSAYRLVDVSAEPLDGNPAHSGNSLLRGTLTG